MADTPPTVPPARRILETVHLTAVGIWLGTLISTGIFAALVFGSVRELDPTLDAFAAYQGSHADLLAGFVQNRVFVVVDIAQFVFAIVGLASLIALVTLGRLPLNRWSNGLRICGFAIAMGLVSYHLLVLAPRMSDNLLDYWAAAEAGEVDRAEASKAAFDADHPAASNALKGTAAALVLAMLAGAFSASGGAASVIGPTDSRPAKRSKTPAQNAALEEPKLAQRGARP